MPLFKTYKKNTLIFPVTNYFLERIDKIVTDKVTKEWCIHACAAAHSFSESIIFEFDVDDNWFYHRRRELTEERVRDVYRALIPFYYFYDKLAELSGEVNTIEILKVFQVDSFLEELESYVDFTKDHFVDDAAQEIIDKFGLPIEVFASFYRNLFKAGFVKIGPKDIKLLVRMGALAKAGYENIVS